IDQIGENRVQEAQAKKPEVRGQATWRLIGPLQRNKVRRALELFDRLDAIDRWEVAAEVSRRALAAGRVVPVLVEVNAGGEAQKHGFAPEAVPELFSRLGELPGLRVEGLMTVAPWAEDPEAVRPVFRRMRELRERLRDRFGLELPWLSMGMSHDFEVAVEEGATMIRLGTALVGPRPAAPGR
ncbi:MAG TPA: YggS family pyridoxal phosphate-dependent enzyme, partial [Limnochorda sp.]